MKRVWRNLGAGATAKTTLPSWKACDAQSHMHPICSRTQVLAARGKACVVADHFGYRRATLKLLFNTRLPDGAGTFDSLEEAGAHPATP